ncbi:hypothetical protein M0805_008241 [Coniferiporia weirii]|nr:hypothetical protein M0805_008241 [Coniferiporia weirii]
MDKCSAELIALIIERACASDLGRTARNLGLVSKYFRALAEPLELRTLVIAGPEQLRKTLAKVEKARLTRSSDGLHRTGVDVRHLFVSELKPEHALVVDTSLGSIDIWETPKGKEVWLYYIEYISEFWESISTLIRDVSTTLGTLTVIQSWDLPASRSHRGNIVLKALSGVQFPQLKSLTLKSVPRYLTYKEENDSFVPPMLLSLQKLHVIAAPFEVEKVYDEENYGRISRLCLHLHPLLKEMHSRSSRLTHLVICGAGAFDVGTLAGVLSGSFDGVAESSSTLIVDRRLPGRLASAILQQGSMPNFLFQLGRAQYMADVTKFINTVNALCIDGLEAYPPTPKDPGEGNSQYEVLLAEWTKCALQH